jgi:hypothetical protein
VFVVPVAARAQFATSVVAYVPGTGVLSSYTNSAAALGAPAVADSYGDVVDPFDPPWQNSQLVSVGAGGSLTLQFNPPIIKDPTHPFGLDFIIFGNAGFIITNGDYSGGGITDGSLFGNNTGVTHLEVSADGTNWFTLNPALAPTADGLFPSDASGDPGVPVNPALTGGSFAGQGLAGIRALYNGSAGGAGYDLAWAQDTNGNFVNLPIARYVRLDVLSGKADIDAVSTVRGSGTVFADDFIGNPFQNGWKIFGDTNLFNWNPTNRNVEVTWDATQSNSYFYHPLGTILAKDDAFTVSFDLQMSSVGGQQLAVGLLNFSEATNAGFSRGTANTPDLFEFDYFTDYQDFSAALADMTVRSSHSSDIYFIYDNQPMDAGVTYQIVLSHAANSPAIIGEVFTNGVLYTAMPLVYPAPITDFRLDTLSVNSYRDSYYAARPVSRGTVKNFVVTVPPPAIQNLAGGLTNNIWQTHFTGRTNWVYTLQRTTNFQTWADVWSLTNAMPGAVQLAETNSPADQAFYRIRAGRP